MERKSGINPKVLAVTFALVTLIIDLVEYAWHGLIRQPSVMNLGKQKGEISGKNKI